MLLFSIADCGLENRNFFIYFEFLAIDQQLLLLLYIFCHQYVDVNYNFAF